MQRMNNDSIKISWFNKGNGLMTEKMKAARFYEAGKPLRIDKIPVPKLDTEDVLVEIKAWGICGSDIHIVYDGSTPSEMQSVADLVVGGKLDLSDSISERFPLEEVNKWLEHLYKKIGSPIHIVVEVK